MKRFIAHLTVLGLVVGLLLPYPAAAVGEELGRTGNSSSEEQVFKHKKPLEYPTLSKANRPEDAGFSSKKLREVDKMIEEEIENGFPGAALVVIKDGKIVKNSAYGSAKVFDGSDPLNHPQKMKTKTMFDLASNTKMYAVNFSLQHLVSEGKINLEEKIQHYFPEFKDSADDEIKGKGELRIIDLLHHTAGFPSSIHYHNPERAGELYSQERSKTLSMILKTPLQYEPGTKQVYSDIDYMLLGFIIEKITGEQLDRYTENHIYKPLGLKHTLFNPLLKGFKEKDFAATELHGNTRDGVISFPNIRTYTLQGEVHDEKSFYSMDGISGHAGLFSTTSDLAVLMQVMLNDGGYGNIKLFDKQTIDKFVEPYDMNPTYGLGWRLNGDSSMEWMFSEYAGKEVFGHTGWTGTVTVIDRENNLAIALLTNKKHSPVIDPLKDPHKFQGDTYSISQYGSVISAVYEALNH
ncbi:penicillin binding protein PBP4B [Cytobacillus firmus]|uniref:penicillin binding protein PBP4B n=1 Tax=Cytobacillus firmus TaxID=1399 RepID=UPI0018CFCA8D|nr:penicillin binding protein PBP4B [Cytobacillus firmus]MBG9547491.1 esterase [Cytobacillus firmus]MBG9603657.1 esterase [Cytobacillus firmus]MBG9654732.1 esterase [Cytobacillus firmus]MDD9310631.1 penicillin binding protein PBP4B [Cytobacillus firmus]MED1906260.1 penicillin binding protein PBP4B [Cytobacillus firmus]